MEVKECIVRGVLSYVLRASCFVGIAPLHFDPVPNGYRVTISDVNAIFRFVSIAIINICGYMSFLLGDILPQAEINFVLIFFLLEMLSISIFSLIGIYNAISRMKNMIENLDILEKIKTNAIITSTQIASRNRKGCLILIIYFICFTIYCCNHIIYDIATYEKKKLIITGYVIFTGNSYIMVLLLAQFLFFILEVEYALKSLNEKMNQILNLWSRDTIIPDKSTFRKLRQLADEYVSICHVVDKMNKTEGIIALMTFSYFILTVLSNVYFEIIYLSLVPVFGSSQILLHILCITQVTSLTESCHRIDREVTKTRKILSKLLIAMTKVGMPISEELELLFKQLVLNKPVYCPVGIFTLLRSKIISIYSVVVTYLLFMIDNSIGD